MECTECGKEITRKTESSFCSRECEKKSAYRLIDTTKNIWGY